MFYPSLPNLGHLVIHFIFALRLTFLSNALEKKKVVPFFVPATSNQLELALNIPFEGFSFLSIQFLNIEDFFSSVFSADLLALSRKSNWMKRIEFFSRFNLA